MALRLVHDDSGLSLALPLGPGMSEAIGIQIQRCLDQAVSCTFPGRLAGSLVMQLDADLQPPTQRQLSYSMAIAKGLGVPLTSEALAYKGAMSEFIRRYAPSFQERQG